MIKNVATTVTYTLYNTSDGTVVVGDVSNHTCKISRDGGTLTTCTNTPSEVGNGVYKITLSASETDCAFLTLVVTSSTMGLLAPPISLTFDDVSLYKAAIPDDYAKATTLTAVQNSVGALPSAASITTSVWSAASRTLSSAVDVSSSSIATIQSGLALSADLSTVSGVVNSISERTTRLPDNPAAVGDAMTLTSAYDGAKNFSIDTAAIADAVLRSDVSRVESAAADYSLCTVVLAHLQSSVNNGVWTIFRTDGTTSHLTRTVTASELANPITGVQG